METKYAIRTTDLEAAEKVYDYLRAKKVNVSPNGIEEIGRYQCSDGGWGMGRNSWIIEGNYTEITDKEYIDKFIDMKTENEIKLEELKKQMAALEEAIKKGSEIKVGDWVITTTTISRLYNKYEAGEIFQAVAVKDGYVYYTDAHSVTLDRVRKATREEIERYKASKREAKYILSSGYGVEVFHDVVRRGNYAVEIAHLKKLTPTTGRINTFEVKLLDAKWHIGCSEGPDFTLKELQEIIKIAEGLEK